MEEKFTGEISKQSSTRALSDIVSNVQNPKAEHKNTDSPRAMVGGVAEPPAKVGGVTDDENSEHDEQRSSQDKRSSASEPAGAAVAQVAHQGLDQEPRERPTEPYDACPSVRDPELLHVRCEKRELQGPSKLNTTGNRRYPQQQPERNPGLSRRLSSFGAAVLAGVVLTLSFGIRHRV